MLKRNIQLLPLQGVNNGHALTQGVASLALGYVLLGFQPVHYWLLGKCLSYENGCSPRCNLTHNRVTRLAWWRTLTRHVKWNKFPSHTWLPYLTPNGVTHLSM